MRLFNREDDDDVDYDGDDYNDDDESDDLGCLSQYPGMRLFNREDCKTLGEVPPATSRGAKLREYLTDGSISRTNNQ